MTTDASGPSATAAQHRSGRVRRRAVVVLLGALAGVLVWALARLLGAGLEVAGEPTPVVSFVLSGLVGGLAGWAVLELLERLAPRPRTTWTVLAVAFLVVSMAGPFGTPDVATGDRVWLALAHVAVAAVVVPGLARTASPRRR